MAPERGVRVSVVILNWNTRDMTLECIDSVRKALAAEACEIIVVDNGSTDGSVEAFREAYSDVTVLALPENLGFPRGMNTGLAQAKGRFLVALNSDTLVGPGSIQRLLDRLEANPGVGAATGEQRMGDGSFLPSGFRFPRLSDDVLVGIGFLAFGPALLRRWPRMTSWFHATGVGEVDWVRGSFVVVRREVFEQVGGFPDEFFMYGEDLAWCRRIRAAGWRIEYVPGAPITHLGGKSSERLLGIDREVRILDTGAIDARRHRHPVGWRLGWLLRAWYWAVVAAKWAVIGTVTRDPEAWARSRVLRALAWAHVELVFGLRAPDPLTVDRIHARGP